MTDTPDTTKVGKQSEFLAELCRYPLMSALIERRTRRVARGASLDAGALSHRSTNAPAPLSKLEVKLYSSVAWA